MTVPFPPDSSWARPSGFAWIGAPSSNRAGIYFPGNAITLSFKNPSVDALKSVTATWTVRDLDGNTVATGSLTSATSVTVGTAGTAPFDRYGWYRLYLTGASNDANWGTSLGAFSFAVWRSNANMVGNAADLSNPPGVSGYASVGTDLRTRGMSVMGPMRWPIGNAASPGAAGSIQADTLAAAVAGVAQEKACYSASGLTDSARPRKLLVAFPNGAYDAIFLPNSTANGTALGVYAKDATVDTTNVWVGTAAGSTSGVKLTVYAPDNVTAVETYDNLASSDAAATAINAASTRLKVFSRGGQLSSSFTTTKIGRAKYDGVVQVVQALYPDVTYFEGPINEPTDSAVEVAHAMRIFSGAVKAGNASAKTMGPNPVQFNDTGTTSFMQKFVDAGGATYCDAISVHAYNLVTGGDFAAGRTALVSLQAFMTRNGLTAKPIWMTELGYFGTVYGVLHPRRMGRWWMATLLLLEQYGIPKEQTFNFYDRSHGFWSFPSFFKYGGVDPGTSGVTVGGALDAYVTMLRVFSEEVFGKTFNAALDFGTPGNDLYLGSIYRAGDGTGTAAVMALSSGLGNVTFTVTGGASTLTVSDTQGNLSTVNVSGGKATVAVGELPVYIRLPNGVGVTPYQHGSFPPIGSGSVVHSLPGFGVVASTTNTATAISRVNDSTLENDYASGPKPWQDTSGVFPCTVTLTFPARVLVDHVVIWSGFAWQSYCALTDFDVQTLGSDGTTWTTKATVTRIPSSFQHVSDSTDAGCCYETFWDDRNAFDIAIPSPAATKGVRLVIRAASHGSAPDQQAHDAGDQSWFPMAVVRKIECYADDLKVHPRPVLALTV